MITKNLLNKKYKKLIKSKAYPFPQEGPLIDIPEQKGVYIIFNPSGDPVHVGCTPRGRYGLWQRLDNHLRGQSSFVWNWNYLNGNGRKLRRGFSFKYIIVDGDKDEQKRERKLLEAYSIGQLCPLYIGKG